MLAAMPGVPPQAQRNMNAQTLEDDRLCAGCNKSVSSDAGGVVVAFGNSLWHVDCFKCAKCENQVNADTNLLLLSDGSPVCANCYNCKVCKKPILDEAVMTGDDSFHAECFTCRSCKNRIDELVFAKTSQGFYCMKCHNERVARSRRHLAKHKQRERERAPGSSSGRPGTTTTTESSGTSRPKEADTGIIGHPDVSRAKHSSDGSSNDAHTQTGSSLTSLPSASETSAASGSGPSNADQVVSPAPPALSVTPDALPPPPYSKSTPPASGNSDIESARSSSSYGYNASSTEPTSPSISLSASNEGSSNDHCGPTRREGTSSPSLAHLNSGGRERSSSLTPHSGDPRWPSVPEDEHRRRSNEEDRSSSLLQPIAAGVTGLNVTKKRDKRNSVNPGLQLEGSNMMQYRTPKRPSTSSAAEGSSSTLPSTGRFGRAHSATAHVGASPVDAPPKVSSPLREYLVNAEEGNSSANAFLSSSSPYQQVLPERPASPRSAPISARSQTGPVDASLNASRRDFGTKFPQRSDSLKTTGPSPVPSSSSAPASATRPTGLPSSPYNGRLNAPTPLRTQRSFDERGGRLSPRKAEFGESGGAKRSRSVSPAPPDVPRSIESGTDTETDNGDLDDIAQSYTDRGTSKNTVRGKSAPFPPAPPPKDGRTDNVTEGYGRSGSQSSSQPNSAGMVEGDDILSEKGEVEDPSASTVTQRTSGFFIAPALPPMRFSMSGTDFNELLSGLGSSGSNKRLSMLPGPRQSVDESIPEEKGEDLDVATARTPTSVASTITPHSDMPSPSDHENANSNSNSSSSAGTNASPSMFKPPERQASLKTKRSAPPRPIIIHPHGERIAENTTISTTTSPISPDPRDRDISISHNGHHRRRSSKSKTEPNTPRSSAESSRLPLSPPKMQVNGVNGHLRSDSNGAPVPRKQDAAELITRRLKEALLNATERQADYIKLDRAFVEAIIQNLEHKRDQVSELSTKLDGMKRTSQMMFDGLSAAENEYNQEVAARRTAEEEVSRLKIEVSGQAARITALSSEERRREVHKQLAKELNENLSGLEQDLSKLKVERDMTLAEVEELSASKSSLPNGDAQGANIGRSLTMRLDNIKRQYQHELVPLTQQKESLVREIADLKEARDIFLEETAVLNARNEELAQLNQQYERRIEAHNARDKSLPPLGPSTERKTSSDKFDSWKRGQAPPQVPLAQALANATSTSSTTTLIDDVPEARQQAPASRPRILRWPGGKANKDVPAAPGGVAATFDNPKGKKRIEHMFQQISVLRFARCDLCGDKMWGSQVRCSTCNMSVHMRCVGQVQTSCTHDGSAGGPDDHLAPDAPSMFGRDLIEQVREDAKNSKNPELFVPIIVEKCIDAVEANAMDYEGIYRKSGGSGQSKAITALFERGDYNSFNLSDSDAFNDVSSVTSVLKNYFRMLPNPLLTFGMHEAFVAAAQIKDANAKGQALKDLVKQLPAEHYHTLSRLMLHLHRIQLNAEVNLMNARNLGVIFGPTLMRSADPSREFADMAGKSLAIEYLIENAPSVFPSSS